MFEKNFHWNLVWLVDMTRLVGVRIICNEEKVPATRGNDSKSLTARTKKISDFEWQFLSIRPQVVFE